MSPRILLKHPGWREKSLPLQLKCSCKGQNGKYKWLTAFFLGCHNHQHLLKMAGAASHWWKPVWLFVCEMVRKQCLPRQLASQWDCQRKTHYPEQTLTIQLNSHQSGERLIIYHWTFPRNFTPASVWADSSATQYPQQVYSSYTTLPIALVHPRGHLWHHRKFPCLQGYCHQGPVSLYLRGCSNYTSKIGLGKFRHAGQNQSARGIVPKSNLNQWETGVGR